MSPSTMFVAVRVITTVLGGAEPGGTVAAVSVGAAVTGWMNTPSTQTSALYSPFGPPIKLTNSYGSAKKSSALRAATDFQYTFDSITAQIEELLFTTLNLKKFSIYVQDYGAPVGFRIPPVIRKRSKASSCRTAMPTWKASAPPSSRCSLSGRIVTRRRRKHRVCY